MCSQNRLMYELSGNTHCNIPSTVHKSISEYLAAGLAGRKAKAAEFSCHAVIEAAVCSVEHAAAWMGSILVQRFQVCCIMCF